MDMKIYEIERKKEREKEMDSKIYEILQTRNVISLRNLLHENELIFDKFLTDFVSQITPLHIAIQHGSVEFAREILRRKPQLAYVLSAQGFSPLRMASANGSVDIVRELLPLIVDVSHDRDSKGWTPVHAAAMKGHVDVLKEFNGTNPEWIRDITDRDETVLHLYVKYNKYNEKLDAMKMLMISDESDDNEFVNRKDAEGNTILHLAAMKKDKEVWTQFVNRKDADGNTILHLAAMKKDMEMITYLISLEMEINAVNMNGFTAMDVVALYPSNSVDTKTVEELRKKGAERSQKNPPERENPPERNPPERNPPERENPPEKATSELQNVLMVVGTLTATLCFQAALVPPGGLWQDDSNMGNNTLDKTNHTAGTSILADKDPNMFQQFQTFNQIVFLLSVILILAGGLVRHRNTFLVKVLLVLPSQLYLQLVLALLSVMIYLCNKVNTPKGLPHEIRRSLNKSNKTLFALTLFVCSYYFIFNLVSNCYYHMQSRG